MARVMMRHVEPGADIEFSAMATLHILVAVECCLALFLALFLATDATNMDLETKLVFTPIVLGTMGVMGLAMALLLKGRFRAARALTAWTEATACGLAVLLTGGFPTSTAGPILLVVPAIFYCLYGGAVGGRSAAGRRPLS